MPDTTDQRNKRIDHRIHVTIDERTRDERTRDERTDVRGTRG